MPSRLIGLFKTLAWTDFQRQHSAAPGAGQFAIGAETHAGVNQNNITAKVESIPGSNPTRYRVKDDITITITFGADSWVEDWVMARDQAFQDRMLNHEQGHYNIVALLARDTFIELMQLKSQTFNSNMDAQRAIARVWTEGTGKAQAIQDLYDEDNQSHHGANAAGQTRWDGFINTAFTTPRTPAMSAPDGTTYKVTLRSVLTGAGLTF
jgi:hypothetical protein